jgi:hypothetical protein
VAADAIEYEYEYRVAEYEYEKNRITKAMVRRCH